jgi:hypothetical protein
MDLARLRLSISAGYGDGPEGERRQSEEPDSSHSASPLRSTDIVLSLSFSTSICVYV